MNSGNEKTDKDSLSLFDTIEDEQMSIEDSINSVQIMTRILAAIDSDAISAKNRLIIKSQFGIGGAKQLTLTEIGEVFNIGRETVRGYGLTAIETIRSVCNFNEIHKENIEMSNTKESRRAKAAAQLEKLINGDADIEEIIEIIEIKEEIMEEAIEISSEMLPDINITSLENSTPILLTAAPVLSNAKVGYHKKSRKLAQLTAIGKAIGQHKADTSSQKYKAVASLNGALSVTISSPFACNIINDNYMIINEYVVSTCRYNDKKTSWKEGSRRLTRLLPGQVNDYLSPAKVNSLEHAYKAKLDTITAIKTPDGLLAEPLAITSRKDFKQSNKEFNETWPCLIKFPERPPTKLMDARLASSFGMGHPTIFEVTLSRTSAFNQIYSSA